VPLKTLWMATKNFLGVSQKKLRYVNTLDLEVNRSPNCLAILNYEPNVSYRLVVALVRKILDSIKIGGMHSGAEL